MNNHCTSNLLQLFMYLIVYQFAFFLFSSPYRSIKENDVETVCVTVHSQSSAQSVSVPFQLVSFSAQSEIR